MIELTGCLFHHIPHSLYGAALLLCPDGLRHFNLIFDFQLVVVIQVPVLGAKSLPSFIYQYFQNGSNPWLVFTGDRYDVTRNSRSTKTEKAIKFCYHILDRVT